MVSSPAHERRQVRRRISGLAGPLFVAGSLNFAAQLGVLAVLGRMGGEAIYVRSLYQPVSLIVLALSVGFAVSNQVAAAISKGAGRPQDVMANAAGLARVWLGLGAALCLVLAVAAPALPGLLDVDAGLRDTFVSFLRWTSAAGLLIAGEELCASSLRGYGYVRQATVLVACTAGVRVGLVAGLGLGTGRRTPSPGSRSSRPSRTSCCCRAWPWARPRRSSSTSSAARANGGGWVPRCAAASRPPS